MRPRLIFFVFMLLLVLMSALANAATAPHADAQAPTPAQTRPPQPTRAPTATPFSVARAITKVKLVGNMVSANQAALAFSVGGRVKELPVAEGTVVQAGTLLGSLDTAVLEAQVAQAQANLDAASATWTRIQQGPSADDIAVAKSNVDRAKAAVDQAQIAYDRAGGASNPRIGLTGQAINLQAATIAYQIALATFNLTVNHPTPAEREVGQIQFRQSQLALDLAKQNLNNAKLVAPFTGTLISVTPKVGESVGANTGVMVLADLGKMQVLVNSDETTLAHIQLGQKVTIVADALGEKTLTGTVKKIGLLATTTTTIVTVPVWIDLDATDAPLYPGLSATVEITLAP